MEAILFILALVLLVLMLRLISRLSSMSHELRHTREQMMQLIAEVRRSREEASTPPTVKTEKAPSPTQAPSLTTPPAPPVTERNEDEEAKKLLAARIAAFEDQPKKMAASRAPMASVEAPVQGKIIQPPPPPARPARPTFWERHPDLEKFIGENLVNKIGITVLVIGIGLLLRYAIGQGLISETARTLIGLAAGGLLIFFAHRSRKSFRAFSSVLVAGGIAVFYFSVAIAFHQYGIIGQTPAFLLMVAITGIAVLFTLAYDRKELAVIALLGGFATPFLASSGEGNFKVLFSYLLILNIGMLVLSNFKKWHVINVIAFVLTLLIFCGWMIGPYDVIEPPPILPAFGFASAFFLVFFLMNLRYNLRHRQNFQEIDHVLLLANTAAYYGAGMYLLGDLHVRVTGLFTVLLGLFYLLFALYFHRREGIPRSLKLMLIGLVLTFISLAAPVQLEGNHITLFWAAESALLLWFAQRTSIRLVERSAVIVSVLMIGSLWMDLFDVYAGNELLAPLINKGWVTGMAVIVSLTLITKLLRRTERSVIILPGLDRATWALASATLAIGLLYLVNYLEIRHQLGRIYLPQVVNLALICWSLLFFLVLDHFKGKEGPWKVITAVLMGITGLFYITVFYMNSRHAWEVMNSGGVANGAIAFHYIGLLLMLAVAARLIQFGQQRPTRDSDGWRIHLWVMTIFLVILASQELDHAMILSNSSADALSAGRRIGYPILWGLGSFLMMWLGMRRQLRMLRVIALCLFAVTLLKLFLFDIRDLSEGGRVAAFIFLGILLLVISFMYQKLKGLVLADGPEAPADHDAN